MILFVSRDTELARVVEEYLGYFKMRVTMASGHDEAREWLAKRDFDAYVIDSKCERIYRLGSLVRTDPDRVVLLQDDAQPLPFFWNAPGLHLLATPFDVADLQRLLADIPLRNQPRSRA